MTLEGHYADPIGTTQQLGEYIAMLEAENKRLRALVAAFEWVTTDVQADTP